MTARQRSSTTRSSSSAALAGTIITSYRLTFRYLQLDTVYWLITAVYLLDIPYTFNQAVKKGLVLYADRRSIARQYLRGWFASMSLPPSLSLRSSPCLSAP